MSKSSSNAAQDDSAATSVTQVAHHHGMALPNRFCFCYMGWTWKEEMCNGQMASRHANFIASHVLTSCPHTSSLARLSQHPPTLSSPSVPAEAYI